MATANVVWIGGVAYSPKHPIVLAHYEKIKAQNDAQPVGGLCSEKPKRNKRHQGEDRTLETTEGSIHYSIALTVYRRRLLDGHDNARSALKPLVDLITKTLGFSSDDCKELQWEYHQVITTGATGTHVLISKL